MINFKKIELVEKEEATFLTHCGTMHADEVFATAFLSFLFDVRLARVKEITDDDRKRDVIIYDIGYGKFDHHQEDGRVRENGIKYAAFGLLFDYYGKEFLEEAKREIKAMNDRSLKSEERQDQAIELANKLLALSDNSFKSIMGILEVAYEGQQNEEGTPKEESNI